MSSNGSYETRTMLEELRSLEKKWLVDLGHPLLNRVADSFLKAAAIGAIQAVTRESYFTAVEGEAGDTGAVSDSTGSRKRMFADLKGTNSNKSLEAMVKSASKESFHWGLAAGMYSGLSYGLGEARGTQDWKNSMVAGAVAGAAVALTSDHASHERIVQCAITGAAMSTAANVLSSVF